MQQKISDFALFNLTPQSYSRSDILFMILLISLGELPKTIKSSAYANRFPRFISYFIAGLELRAKTRYMLKSNGDKTLLYVMPPS